MKKPAIICILLFSILCGRSQRVQIIVPGQVVVGNAFQIQYIINDPAAFVDLSPPQFDNLQLISGPNYYKGNSLVKGRSQAIENITFTVVPLKAGTIRINPITARFKNNEEESTDEITIAVMAKPKASFNALSTYTDIGLYAPSSKTNLDQLIRKNLFIKTEVDKRVCFAGEAITATFKLYSRLQSTSEVINAPSLYGFSVMDMLDINEAHQAVETIDEKIFNTSVLRKLQLYPAQTGKLMIDAMQLQNTIEFNDSVTGKKLKVEKLLASNPVEIVVKSLPEKEPADYTGAVGKFKVAATVPHAKISANTQGKLVVTIAGKGNFIQFGPPVINWPEGFDVFDPIVSDELNKNTVATEGQRNYVFSFTADHAGNYVIPPVTFSFFDPSSAKFKRVRTDSLALEVTPAYGSGNPGRENKNRQPARKYGLLIAGIVAIMGAMTILVWKRKGRKAGQPPADEQTSLQRFQDIASLQMADKQFCSEIQRLLSTINSEYNLTGPQRQELHSIQNDCQLLIYSDIDSEGKKEDLRRRTEDLLKQLDS